MENATKALIIAAAILIAIVLISLGVYVLSIGQESISNVDMSSQEVTTFNAQFESYEGQNVLGSKVNALLSAVLQNNRTEGTAGRQVSVNGDIKIEGTTQDGSASTGTSYSVTMNYDNTTGLITSITINSNSSN